MEIQAFFDDQEAMAAFLELPGRLYASNPDWIPPLRQSIAAQLNPSANPFFRYGKAMSFLAHSDGRVQGRCTAFYDPRLLHADEPIGMVGFFEVEDHDDVSAALLDRARDWLREQGAKVLWGPMNFGIFGSYRFKTKGFDRSPFMGEPLNPPYYPAHFQQYGFSLLEASACWDLDEDHVRAIRDNMAAGYDADAVASAGYSYRPFEMDRYDADMKVFYDLTMQCFTAHTGFVRISYEEFAFWNQSMRLLMEPSVVSIICAPGGGYAGAGYCYPDYAEVLRRLDGDADMAKLSSLRQQHPPPDRLIFHTGMSVPQHRLKGLLQGCYLTAIDNALARGITRGVGAFAKLGNPVFERIYGVAERSREYAVYSMPL